MKCKRCGGRAKIQLRHHNANFCQDCFLFFFQRQVERAVEHEKMFSRDEEVLVAVSGGKDSLALWDVLVLLGYRVTGLHLALGIGEYSDHSTEKTKAFAEARNLPLITVALEEEAQSVPTLARFSKRSACAACGLAKRHFFDRIADERGFKVLATGHNLDDEAARLLGNVLRWQTHYLAKQRPVLEPNHPRFARKVRPLFRLGEYETAVYAFLRKIDYVIDECPNSVGATQLIYKEALNRIEAASPGTKLSFVTEFLGTAQPIFESADSTPPNTCARCGMPCFSEVCSFCNFTAAVSLRQERWQQRQASLTTNDCEEK